MKEGLRLPATGYGPKPEARYLKPAGVRLDTGLSIFKNPCGALARTQSAEGQLQTILVVDDDEGQVLSLQHFLEREGFKTLPAKSGPEALKALDQSPCDLVLLDVSMPGMDGYEVCKKIRSTDKIKSVPVIFLTGRASSADFRLGTKSGGDTYITKPFRNNQLLMLINSLLSMRRR